MRIAVTRLLAPRRIGWASAGLVALIVAVAALGSLPAHAAPSALPVGITISPSLKDITINPGLIKANTTVTITNNSGSRLIGTIRLLDIDTSQSTGFSFLDNVAGASAQYNLANYLSLPNGDVLNLASGQSVTIPVVIDNRTDLAPGGHYGAVVVGFGSPSPAGVSAKADFKQQLASLLFVRKRGGERYGLELNELRLLPANEIPSTVVLKFHNSGNVHVAPLGYITVADQKGKVVSKGIINTDATLLLPGRDKLLETTMQATNKHPAAGRYTVTAHYRYDEAGAFTTKSVQFSYKGGPNLFIVAAFVSLGLGLLLLIILLKIRRQR